MIYCLHHYNIPLLWRWQLHSCKFCDLLQRKLGLPQTAGKWYLHLRYSQHHLRRPNHPGSRWVVGTEWRDWEVRLLGDHWELLTLALVPAVPCQAPQASWCCTNGTARAGTSTGCWLESYTCSEASQGCERPLHMSEVCMHIPGGQKHLGIPVLDICLLKPQGRHVTVQPFVPQVRRGGGELSSLSLH